MAIEMTEPQNQGGVFNEDSLRAAIVGVWGEHGAHADVFDHVVKLARLSRLYQEGLRQIVESDYPADAGNAETWAQELLDRPEAVEWEKEGEPI